MSVKLSQVNIFAVGKVDGLEVEKMIDVVTEQPGQRFDRLRDVFYLGCICADYVGDAKLGEKSANELMFDKNVSDQDIEQYYKRLTTAMFVDLEGQPIPPTSTIYLEDKMNMRNLFAVVAYPGVNIVYYEKYERLGSPSYAVTLVSPVAGAKLANHMEPEWTEGNHHDRVTMAQMFGFEYDKITDEVICPEGRPQSSFKQAVTNGAVLLNLVREMMHPH